MTALTAPRASFPHARTTLALTLGLALLGGALPGGALAQEDAYEPPHDKPGPAAERLLYNSFFVDRAPLDIEAGNMDLYLFGLKTEAAQDLRGTEGVQLIDAPATTVSLILNPAPAREGELNPFSIPEIRRAMQYLVNREAIAQDIYRGAGQPMLTHVGPSDPDFLTVYDIDRGSGIGYDPELARELITEAMTGAGAELVDGLWHFAGEPVRIKLIGRVEDERRDIADLVRAELEQAGFNVAITYDQFGPALQKVYSTDPAAFEWHIYTEGWGRSAPRRYDVGSVNAFIAPWLGQMPGWREEGYWQYENDELDALGQTLYRGEFDSLEERNEIYRTMTRAGLDESVRIWLATVDNSFPAVATLQGMTRDLVAGPRNPWALREAFVPGSDDVRVGHQWVWTERTTYNPIGGLGDVYAVDLWRNLTDPPIWNDPFTGIPQPFRADYEVETAGPEGTLEVPADAVSWDVETKTWTPVEPGTSAVSKVIFDYSGYTDSVWHHGQPITMADAVYSIAQQFELAYDPEKARIETALAVTSRPILETFKGYRLDRRRPAGGLRRLLALRRRPHRCLRQPGGLRYALGAQGGHGRPRLRAAPRCLQRHRREPLQRALAEPRAGARRRAGRSHAAQPRARRVRARGRLRFRWPGAGHAGGGRGPLRGCPGMVR